MTPRQLAAALVVCLLPFTVRAKPEGRFDFVVQGLGDQVDPSIDGQYVVYAGPGPAGEGVDVLLYDVLSGVTRVIGGGPADQDSPDVHFSTAAYRTPAGIVIETWQNDEPLRVPPPGGDGDVANPAVHSAVAAWEERTSGGVDVVVSRYRGGAPAYVLGAAGPGDRPAGDQHAPAAYDDLVAFIDAASQGSVWLHDSAAGPLGRTRICDGPATGVSVGHDGTSYVVAVARTEPGTGDDIEVYDGAGQLLAALPVPGPQRNPHLSGDWVAFEDQSTGFSQVILWRWKTPPGGPVLVFVPRPSETQQRLNDVTIALAEEVRVVFEDTASPETGRDIALYRLPVNPITYDDQPDGWPVGGPTEPGPDPAPPADCGDPAAVPLATLELSRGHGKPQAQELRFPVSADLPVLLCLRAEHVSSAWVTLDDRVVAMPSDFDPHVVDLEIEAAVERGQARIAGVIAGRPGSRLTVRVLPDPARRSAGARAGAGAPLAAAAPAAARGCAAGEGRLASLAALAILLASRRRR